MRTLTGGEVASQVRQILPAAKLTGLSDRTFTLVSHDWLSSIRRMDVAGRPHPRHHLHARVV